MYAYYSSKKHTELLQREGLGVTYMTVGNETFQVTEMCPENDVPMTSKVWDDLTLIAIGQRIVNSDAMIKRIS